MTYEEFCNDWIPLGESLLHTAEGILKSREDAEDALQDVYVKLWRQRDSLAHISNPEAYASIMVRNFCIDRLRTKKQHVELTPGLEASDTSSSRLEEAERIRAIANAIGRLPSNQRKVLEMRTMQGLTYEEISARTGMSPLSLRVLLSRARKTLKKI